MTVFGITIIIVVIFYVIGLLILKILFVPQISPTVLKSLRFESLRKKKGKTEN